jgi:HD-GYP domain-containing protein (c-di-GMP phosphodiesterase class II)
VVSLAEQVRRLSDRLDTTGAEVAEARVASRDAQEAPAPEKEAVAPEPVPSPAASTAPQDVDEESVYVLYRRAYTFVEEVLLAAREGRPFTVDLAFAIIARIVNTEGATDLLYKRAIFARESGEENHGFSAAVITHSVNVCIYALRIGDGMGFDQHHLVDVGVAALLHDIGMTRLPDALIEKKGKFTDQEMAEMRRHPQHGYEILSRLGEQYRWLAEIALQEQERDDGSGYPRGLRGEQIHEYARVIAVADFFAGLTRSRPDRRGMMPYEAVKFIIQNQRALFNQQVLKVLLAKLSAFPLRSYVKLNSGAIGRVVETFESHPLRPSVEILYDSQGKRIRNAQTINLRETPILHIADVISEENLPRR